MLGSARNFVDTVLSENRTVRFVLTFAPLRTFGLSRTLTISACVRSPARRAAARDLAPLQHAERDRQHQPDRREHRAEIRERLRLAAVDVVGQQPDRAEDDPIGRNVTAKMNSSIRASIARA